MHFYSFLGLLICAPLSLQTPLRVPRNPIVSSPAKSQNATTALDSNPTEACGAIRQAQMDHQAGPSSQKPLVLTAELARKCLESVPLDVENTVAFIEGFRNYFAFQSTLAWAANPPDGAAPDRTPVDIMAGLDDIVSKARGGEYKNNYEFEAELRVLLNRLRDGHVNWESKCLEGTFEFSHNFPVVQVASSSGAELQIYATGDIADISQIENGVVSSANHSVSPIESIDGVPVAQYLQDFIDARDGYFHDTDARFNTLFTRRQNSALAPGRFTVSVLAPPTPQFSVRFANGTQHTVQWRAIVTGDFSNIHSGSDYYAANCIKQESAPYPLDQDVAPPMPPGDPRPFVPGYPAQPALLMKAPHDMASAYVIGSGGGGKVGVLALHTFLADDAAQDFQAFVTASLNTFKTARVGKVIVDVSGNGGGNVVLGFDTFKQFFPRETPYAMTNLRAHPAAELFYRAAAAEYQHITSATGSFSTTNLTNDAVAAKVEGALSDPFCYAGRLDPDGGHFKDWKIAYGPITAANGGAFTTYTRWDLASDYTFGGEFAVTAAAPGRNASWSVPWSADDIVLLGDGVCSSTCTIFAEAMHDAGVRSVVYGGRPQGGSMQLMGGVEGSQVLSFATLYGLAQDVKQKLGGDAGTQEEESQWASFLPGELAMPPAGPQAGGINLRNAFRQGSDIPLEYVYTPADYRITLTERMFLDIENLWTEVASTVWGL